MLAVGCSLVRSKRLFLRPDLASSRRRGWAVSNPPSSAGPEPRAAPRLGGEHGEDRRFATARARRHAWPSRRGAPISHGHIHVAAEPRRWPPDQDRSSPEAPPRWDFRTSFQAAPRTRQRIWPGPRATRPTRRSSASTGFAAPPPWDVWRGVAAEAPAFWRASAPGARRCSARRELRAGGHRAQVSPLRNDEPTGQPTALKRSS